MYNDKTDLIDVIRQHKHICWYPSAGGDFRELLFLSEKYLTENKIDMAAADLFILTDINPGYFEYGQLCSLGKSDIEKINNGNLQNGNFLFKELFDRTIIKIEDIQELEPLEYDVKEDLNKYVNKDIPGNYGTAYYMRVSIESVDVGIRNKWETDLVYALVENTNFARNFLIKEHIKMDDVIVIRYGGAFGGSVLHGNWIPRILSELKTEYFIANECYLNPMGCDDLDRLKEDWPELCEMKIPKLETVHLVKSNMWSSYGDVLWCRIERKIEQ